MPMTKWRFEVEKKRNAETLSLKFNRWRNQALARFELQSGILSVTGMLH